MKSLTITDPDIILGLQDEIRRSEESRYDHRLHGLLLVAQGMSCREVAGLLGDSARTVQYWVKRFDKDGLAGLVAPVLWACLGLPETSYQRGGVLRGARRCFVACS